MCSEQGINNYYSSAVTKFKQELIMPHCHIPVIDWPFEKPMCNGNAGQYVVRDYILTDVICSLSVTLTVN